MPVYNKVGICPSLPSRTHPGLGRAKAEENSRPTETHIHTTSVRDVIRQLRTGGAQPRSAHINLCSFMCFLWRWDSMLQRVVVRIK
jgi:hypothetical protein